MKGIIFALSILAALTLTQNTQDECGTYIASIEKNLVQVRINEDINQLSILKRVPAFLELFQIIKVGKGTCSGLQKDTILKGLEAHITDENEDCLNALAEFIFQYDSVKQAGSFFEKAALMKYAVPAFLKVHSNCQYRKTVA